MQRTVHWCLPILMLAGCAATSDATRPPAIGHETTCNAEPALALIGRPDTPQNRRRALELSGSDLLRVLRPGDGATSDYQTARVNLILDGNNRIAEVRCG